MQYTVSSKHVSYLHDNGNKHSDSKKIQTEKKYQIKEERKRGREEEQMRCGNQSRM